MTNEKLKNLVNELYERIDLAHKEAKDMEIEEFKYMQLAKKYHLELQRLAGKKVVDNLNLYQGYENEWIASNYFNETIRNINEKDIFSIYANGASCASTITDCYVDYYYNTNNGMVEGRTQLFDMVLRGIRVGSVSGYYQHGDIYYMYNGDTLTIDSIINKESDLLYGYDNDFFEVNETEGIKQFKAKKEGYTKIDLYTTSGYMTSVYVNILFNKADVETVRDFITNMQEVNIPYTKDKLTQTLMKDYLEAYIREGLQNNPVAKHLELKVTDLPNKTAIIDVYLKHNGNQLNNLSFYNKKVQFKYADEVDQELQNQLKEFKKNIKDKYTLDFDLSMKLAASYEITNDFYNKLYKQVGIEESLQSNIFTTKIVYSGNVRYNKYLIGGAYYEIYIYKDNKLVDMIKTLVNTNFILDRGIVDEVTDDTNYIKEYIADNTGLDVTINHAFDNYYQVTYQGRNFHIMYNKINKVEAEHVQVYDLNDNIRKIIFNTYNLFNKFIDTIMIEAINNYFEEQDILDILRNDKFINDTSSYAIELLLNKLSFKSAFNMMQRKVIFNKISHLNVEVTEKDAIFVKGYLDSPILLNKSDHNMIFEMLRLLNSKDVLYYLTLPYVNVFPLLSA